jgi:cyanophycin synthetase
VLSRRPVVRLMATVADDAIAAQLCPAWPQAIDSLRTGLAAAGVDLTPVGESGTDGAAPSARALSALLASLAASLMQAAQSPGRDFGPLPAAEGSIACFWNDWMDGLGIVAGRQAVGLLECAFSRSQDMDTACRSALKSVFDARQDPFFAPMVRAAEARGIPWRAIRPGSAVLAYGQGARQQWFHGTMSNRQSRVCVHLTQRKHLSIELLRAAGLPVPEHHVATSAHEAGIAAVRLGYPVVVKPDAGSRAANIFLDLRDEASVIEAFETCRKIGPRVLVEKQYHGLPYRVTVCGGRAVAAARHAVPYVTGDGVSSVAALIERCNVERTRPVEDHYTLPLPLNMTALAGSLEAVLARQELNLQSVPPTRQEVFLSNLPSLLNGGIHVNIGELIHPSTLALAEEAAKVLRTDSLGVDFIATDITRPHEDAPLVINEVNSAASPRTHAVVPASPIDIAAFLFAPYFPPGDEGRVPIGAAIGAVAPAALRVAAGLLTAAGETVGLADTLAAEVGGFRLRPVEGSAAHPGRALLRDKRTTVALCAVDAADIVERGLPSDRLDSVVVTGDQLPIGDERTRRALAALVNLPGDALVLPAGVEFNWLAVAAPHRRLILVAEPGTTAPSGAVVVRESAGSGTRLAICHDGRRDPLAYVARAPHDCAEIAWAAALLLGLGHDPAAISRLATQESRPA